MNATGDRPQPAERDRGERPEHDAAVNTKSLSWNSGAMRTPPRPGEHHREHPRERRRPRVVDAAEAGERRAGRRRHASRARSASVAARPEHDRRQRGRDEDGELVAVEHDVEDVEHLASGSGPMPGRCPRPACPRARGARGRTRRRRTLSASHCTSAGSATRRPIVPTMRAYTGAAASRRSSIRSSSRPSSGANTSTERISDGHPVRCPRPCSAGSRSTATVNAIAPCAKLKIPDVWYVSTSPDGHHRVDGAGHGARHDQVEEPLHRLGDLARRTLRRTDVRRPGQVARPPPSVTERGSVLDRLQRLDVDVREALERHADRPLGAVAVHQLTARRARP